jgi:hypothetical protein
MRRYGLYDATRGLTTLVAAGVAGLLLWLATRVGQPTTGRFWAEMGIVAGAGLVMTLSQVLSGWTKGLRLRISPGTFAIGFLPVLVCVGWILMASQPGTGWHEGTIVSWSRSIGLIGLVHDLALWNGVLAFGFGLVLGLSFDTVPALIEEPAAAGAGPMLDRHAADEPVTAERRTMPAGWPRTAPVGPRRRREPVTREGDPTKMD